MRASWNSITMGLLVASLVLAACSGGGEASVDDGTGTEAAGDASPVASEREPADEMHQVRAGIASIGSLSAGPALLLMADPSLAEEHGLDAEWREFGGDPTNCMTAVISGDVDFCVVSPASGAFANAEGQSVSFIASLTQPMSELVLSAEFASDKGVSADAPLDDRLRALEGATIATANLGSTHASYFQLLYDEVDLAWEDDIGHLTLTDPVAMMEGIRQGQFDGAIWSTGALEPIIADGAAHRWVALSNGDVPQFEGLPFVTAAAQTSWVEANPEAVQAFNDAIAAAATMIQEETGEAGAILKPEFFPDMEQDLFDAALSASAPLYNANAGVTPEAWETVMEIYQASAEDADVVGSNPYETVIADAAKRL